MSKYIIISCLIGFAIFWIYLIVKVIKTPKVVITSIEKEFKGYQPLEPLDDNSKPTERK